MASLGHNVLISGWNCQPWPSRSQNWMFVYFIIILSRSQQIPTSSSQNQVELGEWATGHFMHCVNLFHVRALNILYNQGHDYQYYHENMYAYGSFWDKTQFCTLVCSSVVSSFTLLIFIDFIVMIYCTTLVYIVETVSSQIINYWFDYGNLNSQNIRKFKVHFVTFKTLFSKNVAHS